MKPYKYGEVCRLEVHTPALVLGIIYRNASAERESELFKKLLVMYQNRASNPMNYSFNISVSKC